MTEGAALRAFLAVPLSSEMRERYSRVHGEIVQRFAGFRWVRPENLHVTVRFLGDVDARTADGLRRDVEAIAAGEEAFPITLGGLGSYGGRKAPRVIWIGIEQGAVEMRRIAEAVELASRQLGFRPETRAWSAHVTLARNPRSEKSEGWEEAVASSGLSGLGLDVEGVSLISSRLLPQGPAYTPVWTAALARPSQPHRS